MKLLARILSVVQEELAWSELVPIDGFILPHLLDQLVSTECVNKAERTWKKGVVLVFFISATFSGLSPDTKSTRLQIHQLNKGRLSVFED